MKSWKGSLMNRKKFVLIIVMVMACLVFAGCSKDIKADISGYENNEITIEGISEHAITLTAGELKDMKCTEKTVTTVSKGREITVEAAGPTLETLLGEYGIPLSNVTEMTVIAADGYTKQFDSGFFTTHPDVYLSIANGDDPLEKDEQPMSLVIPATTSDNWVKGIKEIRFK